MILLKVFQYIYIYEKYVSNKIYYHKRWLDIKRNEIDTKYIKNNLIISY